MIMQAVRIPTSPRSGPACPNCETPRRVVIDGLTGHTKVVCDECPRREALAQRHQAFDAAAIARVATMFELTVEQLREKLEPPKPKTRPCTSCGEPIAPNRQFCAQHTVPSNRPVSCTGCGADIPKRARGRAQRICGACRKPDTPIRESKPPKPNARSIVGRRWGFCLVCEIPLDFVRGRGRPPCYCEEHRPAHLKKQNSDRAAALAALSSCA